MHILICVLCSLNCWEDGSFWSMSEDAQMFFGSSFFD
jgi:hypothetical protein